MQKTYAFGEFVVRPAQRLLTRTSGEAVDIHAKAFDALMCLVQRPGEVVSRAELARSLWPKVIVEDNNLSQTIRALRLALGDAGPPYRMITTVPRRGYQFIAAVVEIPDLPARSDSAPSRDLLAPVRPKVSRVALYFACIAVMTLIVPTMTRWAPGSETEVPAPAYVKPVADTVVEGQPPSWPLPEVVACLPESARRMDPERCAAAFDSVQRAERRRKHGLYGS